MSQKLNILVVGVGPSGSSAAYHLASSGHRVTLIAPTEPNEKVCGGGVPIKCLNRFQELYKNFDAVKTLHDQMTFSFDGHDLCQVPMIGGMAIVSRRDHDNYIFQKALTAGADYKALRFKSCQRIGTQWQVETDGEELIVDFIVGADGATSRVRNQLTTKLPREAYFKGQDYLLSKTDLPLHIGFDKNLDGYLWVFPRANNCSVGLVDFSDDRKQRLQILDDYMARFDIKEEDIIKKRSAIIPSLRKKDLKDLQIAGEGWALVGDAAGLAEPLTGEGIYYALYSGWLIADSLEKGNDYNKEWRKAFRQIVEESSISRKAYGLINSKFCKRLLSHSSIFRQLMGEQLAAQKSGRYYRMKLLLFTPLILLQALFATKQTLN